MVLKTYVLELKESNPGSIVIVVSERKRVDELPIFQRMYICLAAIKEGFIAGCRRLIGLDGCFSKGLMKAKIAGGSRERWEQPNVLDSMGYCKQVNKSELE